MSSRDAIETAIGAPIDWGKLEQVVYEILVNDDMPSLRKLGGVNDGGADALQESFYQNERRLDSVVQITSEVTQRYKVDKTITRLSESGFKTQSIVVVFRHPVSSENRSQMIEQSMKKGIALDVRDRDYLVTQLGKSGSTIFSRHFGSLEDQLRILMSDSDPLEIASGKYQQAMLATLGAFLINPRARLARSAMFEKTVLAVIAADGGVAKVDQLLGPLKELLPEEKEALTQERIRAAVEALVQQNLCRTEGLNVIANDATKAEVARTLAFTKTAYNELIKAAINSCRGIPNLNDAKKGFIERNIRSALLLLLKAFGPISDGDTNHNSITPELSQDLLVILSRDIDESIARHALAGLAGFIESKENSEYLGIFVKTYSALAIRNLDPIGRKWQRATLERSVIALDTDAVLMTIIEELPDHKATLDALKALHEIGTKIVIPDHVLLEAADHISRANRTYKRFSSSISRLSPAVVDEEVWHVVVRGYYYAQANNFKQGWDVYWRKYFDSSNPEGYIKHIISRRLPASFEPLDTIKQDSLYDFEQLSAFILQDKERGRFKAQFREDMHMEQRTRRDVKMALYLAQISSVGSDKATGYLISLDSAFRLLQSHPNWNSRPKVHINTRALPSVASMVCGTQVHSDTLIRLLLNPIVAASAHLMKDEINTLASIGVDFRSIPLDRLDWDLSKGLKSEVDHLSAALASDQNNPTDDILKLAKAAQNAGYQLEPHVQEMVQNYEALKIQVQEEYKKRVAAETKVIEVGQAAAGQSKKGKTRFHKALRELGIENSSDQSSIDDEQ